MGLAGIGGGSGAEGPDNVSGRVPDEEPPEIRSPPSSPPSSDSRFAALTPLPRSADVRAVNLSGRETGLYISRQVEPESAQRIFALAIETLGVPPETLVPPDKMHVTVVRSPTSLREPFLPDLRPLEVVAHTDWHLVRLGAGIALRFDAPALKTRWLLAKEKGAGWTYGDSDYVAHVTITYNAHGLEFEPIPLRPDFPLKLRGERAESFDPKWVKHQGLDEPDTNAETPDAG